MKREIKFRLYDKEKKKMSASFDLFNIGDDNGRSYLKGFGRIYGSENEVYMQFTGLKDKNGVAQIYEGDIIDIEGKIKGNIYESPQIYKEGTDCLIEGMGTEKWRNTESIAMGLGCKYA